MPGRVYSALNTGGTPYETQADVQSTRNQSQAADWMLQQAMMQQRAQQFQASLADRQNDRLAQREIEGTYAQRSAGDQSLEGLKGQYNLEGQRLQNEGNYATAGLQFGASNKRAALEERAYNAGEPLLQAQNAAKLTQLQRQQMLQEQIFKDVQGGTDGFAGIDPRARQRIQTAAYAKAAGLEGDFNQADQGDQLVSAYLNSRISDPNVNPNDIPAFINAARTRDISHLPGQRRSVEQAMTNAPEIGLQADVLGQSADKFGSMFDANPAKTVELAKGMVQALMAKGVSEGEAKTSIARKLIADGKLPPKGSTWGEILSVLPFGYTINAQADDAAPLREYLGYNP